MGEGDQSRQLYTRQSWPPTQRAATRSCTPFQRTTAPQMSFKVGPVKSAVSVKANGANDLVIAMFPPGGSGAPAANHVALVSQ